MMNGVSQAYNTNKTAIYLQWNTNLINQKPCTIKSIQTYT